MTDFFKNLIAKIKLNTFMFNNEEDDEVNDLFDQLMDIPWIDVKFETHYIIITTITRQKIGFWSANKYYAYAAQGYVQNGNDDNDFPTLLGGNVYNWNSARPSAWRILKLTKMLKKYKRNRMGNILGNNTQLNSVDNIAENMDINF